jgi:hypothetical protein
LYNFKQLEVEAMTLYVRRIVTILTAILMFGVLWTGLLAGPSGATDITTLGDGSSEETLDYDAAGEDATLYLSIPKMSAITSAEIMIEGLGKSATSPQTIDYDYNDTSSNQAWSGSASDLPTTSGPDNYKSSSASTGDLVKMQYNDAVYYETIQTGGNFIYQHFKFLVPMTSVSYLKIVWDGGALVSPNIGFGTGGARLYIWNDASSAWEEVGNFYCGEIFCEQGISGTYTSTASNYINDSQELHMIAITYQDIGGIAKGLIDTDFAGITATGLPTVFPEDPYLDVGDDGDNEWYYTGTLMTDETASGNDLIFELQEHVDAGGTGTGNVDIPLALGTGSEGVLRIHDILISVNEYVNQAPELAENIGDASLDEDTDAEDLIDLKLHFDDDLDAPGDLTFTVLEASDTTHIDATIDGDGMMDFTTPTENWHGSETFKVRCEDSHGLTVDSNTFTVTVNPVNDPPELDPIGALTATEGTAFMFRVTATDVDKALQPTESLTYLEDSDLFTINSITGMLNFTPVDADVGIYSVNFTAKDKAGLMDSEIVTFTVEDINNAPVLAHVGDRIVDEDVHVYIELSATDADDGDTVTFSSTGDLFTVSSDGIIDFTPVQEDVGTYDMVIEVSDGQAEDSETVTFTVRNVNDPPVIKPIASSTAERNRLFELTVEAEDEDLPYDPAENLSFSDNSNMFDIDAATGKIEFTPTLAHVGTHTIKITVIDAYGDVDTAELDLEVVLVNDAPVAKIVTPDNKTAFKEGKSILLDAEATDADGDTLTYKWKKGDTVLGEDTNVTLPKLKPGKHTITLEVSDGIETSTVNVTLRIKSSGGGMPGFEVVHVVIATVLALVVMAIRRPGKKD